MSGALLNPPSALDVISLNLGRTLQTLRANHTAAISAVDAKWGAASGVKASVKRALSGMVTKAGVTPVGSEVPNIKDGIILQLETLRTSVMSGAMQVSRWDAMARECKSQIEYAMRDFDNWTFTGVLTATAAQSVEDVKQGAKVGLAIGLPMVALILVAYILFATVGIRKAA